MALETEASSVMKKNLPEEDELTDDHDLSKCIAEQLGYNFLTVFSCPSSLLHIETNLNVDSNKLKTDAGNKGIETSKTPLKPEDYEPWNPSKPIPEGFVPWLEHDHDKCVAEQLGLDPDAPIPAHCKPTSLVLQYLIRI